MTGVLLSFIAPYETGSVFSAWEGLAFWTWSSVAGALLPTACDWLARGLTKQHHLPRYLSSAAAIVAAAVPATLIVHAAAPAINDQIRLLRFWQLYPSVLILCIAVQIVLMLLSRSAPDHTPRPAAPEATEQR